MEDPYSFQAIKPLWGLVDPLTVRQAAALIAGFDPTAVDQSGNFFVSSSGWTESEGIAWVHTALAALVNAINARKLKAVIRRAAWLRGWDEEPEEGERYAESLTIRDEDANEAWATEPPRFRPRGIIYRVSPDWDLTTVERADLIAWMKSRGITSGFFFPDVAADTPGYLDSNNLRYAPKLAAAINAWLAVTDPGGKSAKQALEKWLREHAAAYGLVDDNGNPVQQAVEECAKVANWRPGGGVPKTPGA
ncbi:hypothetical protein [Paraburkholderia bryophila]|uniref:Uncharacterized protein n=1 Tax=Paraburkholderia bryophila TaxID=420952 RepID=A0A7Z0B6Z1_9BURK|nr:hypothetical protein [Paraburkholderia bryophila]NYH23961.1 hypothetical protein [Paraburkholderia bryophila]